MENYEWIRPLLSKQIEKRAVFEMKTAPCLFNLSLYQYYGWRRI